MARCFGAALVMGCSQGPAAAPAPPPAGVEYRIDGQPARLGDGSAASSSELRYSGPLLRKDLDGDGREDIAFIATWTGGGSGTFYYLLAALDTGRGHIGSGGVLLGDRVAPGTVASGPGRSVLVTYAERRPQEPMTAEPSVTVTRRLLIDPGTRDFGEVLPGLEGEADPSRMTLTMKTWTWVDARYNDDSVVTPERADRFTLTFGADGRFSAATDCNRLMGSYTAGDGRIAFGEIASTKMFCERTQEAVFAGLLREVHLYHFTPRGELILELPFDSGIVTFR